MHCPHTPPHLRAAQRVARAASEPGKHAVSSMQSASEVAHVEMQHMRAVWVSAEHQCAVWCNQVAAAVGSAVVHAAATLLAASDRMAEADADQPVLASVAEARLVEVRRVVADLHQDWAGPAPAAAAASATADAAMSDGSESASWEDVEVSEVVGMPWCSKVPQAASQCAATCSNAPSTSHACPAACLRLQAIPTGQYSAYTTLAPAVLID